MRAKTVEKKMARLQVKIGRFEHAASNQEARALELLADARKTRGRAAEAAYEWARLVDTEYPDSPCAGCAAHDCMLCHEP